MQGNRRYWGAGGGRSNFVTSMPAPDTNVFGTPLDSLSSAAKTSLRAVWWTHPMFAAFVTAPYDATHFYDQSGASKDVTSGASIGTVFEGAETALVFDTAVPNTFTRGDSLGLAADPALTIVWKMKCTTALANFPTLFALGTSGSSELSLYFQDGGGGAGFVTASNFSSTAGVTWRHTLASELAIWQTWVLTKPAGAGFANTWTLYQNGGSALVPDYVVAGSLALGATHFQIGDWDGGGFPFGGHLAGMLIFERVLSGADLDLVKAL